MRPNIIDGWWPKLRYPYLICGSTTCSLIDVRDGRVLWTSAAGGYFPVGWLSDGRFVVSHEVGGNSNDSREVALVDPADAKLWPTGSGPFNWTPPFRVGSPLALFEDRLVYGDYSTGHPGLWSGSLDGTAWSRLLAPVRALGASIRVRNGRLACHMLLDNGQYEWWILDAAGTVLALPSDHIVIPGPSDWHGTGYYGPATLVKAGTPAAFRDITVTPRRQESVPVLFPVAGVEWAATATADDHTGRASVLVRPPGETDILQLHDFPAVWLDVEQINDNGEVVIAGCDDKGRLTIQTANVLTAARKPYEEDSVPGFTPLPVDNPNEHPITGPVDVLPYIVGDETDWPADSGNDGVMHCFWEQWGETEGRALFQKNVTTGKSFEVWEFLANWVRHRRDRIGEPRGEYYEFSDGRWLPRFVTPEMIGRVVVSALSNKIRFGHTDGTLDEWSPFPYEMRVQICTQERLVFHYDPAPGSGNYEVYECLRNRGWRRWWAVEHGTNRILTQTEWMSNADPSRRKRPVGYVPDPRKPLPDIPDESKPVAATISEPTFPVEGPAPLAVRCVAQVTDGEAAKFRWQHRRNGGAWWDEHAAPDYRPAWDNDHTFRFTSPGEYEIRLITYGTDGSEHTTGKQRKVIVR